MLPKILMMISFVVMHSGALFHSSPCSDMIQNFKIGKFVKVRQAYDESLDIKGDVVLQTHLCY